MSAELTVISWRDIPVQVVASVGRKKARAQLSSRFQEAIDAAAMKAGLEGTDEYLAQWTRASRPCGQDLQVEANDEAERIEEAWSDAELLDAVRAEGIVPAP